MYACIHTVYITFIDSGRVLDHGSEIMSVNNSWEYQGMVTTRHSNKSGI